MNFVFRASFGLAAVAFLILAQSSIFAQDYNFTSIDDPLAVHGTMPAGINDFGQIVGVYDDAYNATGGFLYTGGVFTGDGEPFTLPFTILNWYQ